MNRHEAMFLVGVALSAVNQPDRWVHVGGSATADAEYLDRESIQRSGGTVTLWTRRDLARGRGSAWHEIEIDCSGKTTTILAYVRDDGGNISHNVARPHSGSAPIAPGSVEERVLDIVCR